MSLSDKNLVSLSCADGGTYKKFFATSIMVVVRWWWCGGRLDTTVLAW